jgi:hypothetical protein
MMLPTETSERFLRAIAAQVPAERIAEAHFFAPIRQGGVESGVAVVAAWPNQPAEAPSTDTAFAETPETESDEPSPEPERPRRPVVYTARYRLTLKGPDRGKWECTVVAEAEAPLGTVDTVVRGVLRRAGDADDATRVDGDEIRAFLATVTVS